MHPDPAAKVGVAQALAALPRDQRLVLVLRHWVGLSAPEIAEQLGCPVGTVKSRASRAAAHLRADLTEPLNENRTGGTHR